MSPTVYRKADWAPKHEHKKWESENHSAELVLKRTKFCLPHWPVVSTYESQPQAGVWCVLQRGQQNRDLLDTFFLSWRRGVRRLTNDLPGQKSRRQGPPSPHPGVPATTRQV